MRLSIMLPIGFVHHLAFQPGFLFKSHCSGLQPYSVKKKKDISFISCPLGHAFFILLKYFLCIQCLLDGFVKLPLDNQIFKVIIWAVTFQTVNYKV